MQVKSSTLFLVAATCVAVIASPMRAQSINYFTQGYFTGTACSMTGPTSTTGPSDATCSAGGLTLTYLATTATGVAAGNLANLGVLTLAETGPLNLSSLLPGSIGFHLILNQTSPTVGSGVFFAFASTTATDSATFSLASVTYTLPDPVTIGAETYQFVFNPDDLAVTLDASGLPTRASYTIHALVTATPEPASLALVATGLLTVCGLARRAKRRNTNV